MKYATTLRAAMTSSSKPLVSSAVFVFLSLISSGINYLYYPVIARFLTPAEFGVTQALLAVLLQIGAVFAGLNLVTIYLVHVLSARQAQAAISVLQRVTTSLFLILTIGMTLAQSSIMRFLHIDSRLALFIVSLNLVTSIPFIIAFGYLQAQKRFVAAGFLQLSVVSLKLILGVTATFAFGTNGALLGIALGQVAGMVVFWLICRSLNLTSWEHRALESMKPPSLASLRQLKGYGLIISSLFVVNITVSILISFDILSARHYFPGELSGLYSGASTLSNAIVFVCLPIIGVLLPHLTITSLRRSTPAILRTFGIMIGIATTACLALWLIPNFLLGIFGSEYQAMSALLWRLGVLMSLAAILSLCLQVSALYAPLRTALLCVLGVFGLFLSVRANHQTPSQLISTIMPVFATMLAAGVAHLYWIYTHDKKPN